MSDNVIIRTVNQPTMVIVGNQAVSGPAGQDGATGPAGPNSVTSATTTNITGIIGGDGTNVYEFPSSTTPVYNEGTELYEESAVLYGDEGQLTAEYFITSPNGLFQATGADGIDFAAISATTSPLSFRTNGKDYRFNAPSTGNGVQWELPNLSGTFALTSNTSGIPDKLTNGTIAGTLAINSTTISYESGAAAAHRDALGIYSTAGTYTAGQIIYASTDQLRIGQSGSSYAQFRVVNGQLSILNQGGNASVSLNSPLYTFSGIYAVNSAATNYLGMQSVSSVNKIFTTSSSANKEIHVRPNDGSSVAIFDQTAITLNATTYNFGTAAAAAFNTATGELRRVKTTDETRTAASTVIDNTLQASVDAGGYYQFEIQLYIRATGAATFSHGIFFNGTLANTSAGERFGLLQTWFTSSASNAVLAWSAITPPTCNFSATGTPDGWLLRFMGTLQVANAGTFGIQYANAAATGTIVAKAGSYMILNKLNV